MITRRGLPLRWRVAALTALAIGCLGAVAAATAFWVVRSSLRGDLQRGLRADARLVADLYLRGGQGDAQGDLSGPTGGVIVQLYAQQGTLLIASQTSFAGPEAALPPEAVVAASEVPRDWSGLLSGRQVQVALAPFDLGVVAVVADTGFIGEALNRLGRALLLTALLLVLLGAVVGYLLAGSAISPITQLAVLASALGPDRLEAIPYRGPDDEVGQLARVLNDLIARLKASMDAQRTFLAETSHELRTPITGLRGFLDRAFRKASPEVRHDLHDARRIARSMSRLVEDLLQLSRGQLIEDLAPHLVDPCRDVLKPVAEEFPGVVLAGRNGALVLGDPDRLRQLVRNLTANAVRHGPDPSSVTLGLESSEGEVILTVQDCGPGIPEEILPRIFDKFYKGAGGGSGLGLAIAKQIAEQHGGAITVESVPGDTLFRVFLPAVDSDDD
jgi:signal transduction histidine kinase